MAPPTKPAVRPARPYFSSGPCPKRPGWSPDVLQTALISRSHRSADGRARIALALQKTHDLLKLPEDYRICIVPGSDTGAIELALWSLLGARGVDVLAWDAFGEAWVTDIASELKLADTRTFRAAAGQLPDLNAVDFSRDVVFTWNGTTTGVRVPNDDWIADDRAGLTISDATSAVFAYHLDWQKLDVVTFSWQKVLGSEAGLGMLVLSPRAVERLETFKPDRPLPKLFRLTREGRLNESLFHDMTINTPSMLAVEDYLDALSWAETVGGLDGLVSRVTTNFDAVSRWVAARGWIAFTCDQPELRSRTSVCLKLIDDRFNRLTEDQQRDSINQLVELLADDGVAFDIAGYRTAPPGLRIWCGATVETADVEALLPWLDWAYAMTARDL